MFWEVNTLVSVLMVGSRTSGLGRRDIVLLHGHMAYITAPEEHSSLLLFCDPFFMVRPIYCLGCDDMSMSSVGPRIAIFAANSCLSVSEVAMTQALHSRGPRISSRGSLPVSQPCLHYISARPCPPLLATVVCRLAEDHVCMPSGTRLVHV